MRGKQCLVGGALIMTLAVTSCLAQKPKLGVYNGADLAAWTNRFGADYDIRAITAEELAQKPEGIQLLAIGEVALSLDQAQVVADFMARGGRVIAYGKAGYLDGHFNLTRALKAGKYMFCLPIIYPSYCAEDDFVPLAKALMQAGADGIGVHELAYVKGRKSTKSNRKYKGDIPEYESLLKKDILPNIETWMKKDSLPLLGLPDVPKVVWISLYTYSRGLNQSKENKHPDDPGYDKIDVRPERYGEYMNTMEFNVVGACLFRDGYTNVPDAFGYFADLFKKHNVMLRGEALLVVGDYRKKHPEQQAINLNGEKKPGYVDPWKGKEFYAWFNKSVAEMLAKYPEVVWVNMDEPMFGMGDDQTKAAFDKKFGRKPGDVKDPDFIAFREDCVMDLVIKPFVDTVKRVNPRAHIGISFPPSDASRFDSNINLSKYADAGYEIWEPEFPSGGGLARGGRQLVNPETSLVYHTPQPFAFAQLYYAEKERDTESMFKDVTVEARGIKTSLFKGAEVVYWMMDAAGVKWPGVVRANAGQSLYFAFNPFASDKTAELMAALIKESRAGGRAKANAPALVSGWPQDTKSPIAASVLVKMLNDKPDALVVAVNKDNWIYAWDCRGVALSGWPVKMDNISCGASPAAADLDGDGNDEIVTAAQEKIYVWNLDGKPLKGWPKTVKGEPGTPVLADVNCDKRLEIVVGTAGGDIHAWDAAGADVAGFPIAVGEAVAAALAVGDINGDAAPELVAADEKGVVHVLNAKGGLLPGWPQAMGAACYSTPAIGDVDGDGKPEIVLGNEAGSVFVFRADGTRLAGWPQKTGGAVDSSPALADLDGDKKLEILAGSKDGKVYAWKSDGMPMPGWPQATGLSVDATPIAADVNGDGHPEVIAGSWDKNMYVWDVAGKCLPGWPVALNGYIFSTATAADLNGDGKIEIAVAGDDGKVYIWAMAAAFEPKHCPWPMYRQNVHRTGFKD